MRAGHLLHQRGLLVPVCLLGRREGDPLLIRTYLYGPAVCCKPDVSDGGIGLAHLYPAHE
jgi:hypothetical protein